MALKVAFCTTPAYGPGIEDALTNFFSKLARLAACDSSTPTPLLQGVQVSHNHCLCPRSLPPQNLSFYGKLQFCGKFSSLKKVAKLSPGER